RLITRVVDYGGLFHDDVLPGHEFPRWDHRSFRPAGWVERGRERMEHTRPIEAKRAELAAVGAPVLTADEVAEIRAIGDNTGSMALKGAAPDFEGDPLPDRWPLSADLAALAERWSIDPARDLTRVGV